MGGMINMPIVFIWDGQNQTVLENLKNDADIGPALILPSEHILLPKDIKYEELNQPINNMMIAFMSDVFIGTRASSFAANIGVTRVLRGANPESNFIYVKRSQEEVIEICEQCLFLCDNDFCGNDPVIVKHYFYMMYC